MSKKRMIDTAFWSDPWVVDNLEPLERYLFIYLFTNHRTTIAGVYEISLRVIEFETGLKKDQIEVMLEHLKPRVFYENGWLVMANGVKNQAYTSDKIKKGIIIALESVPSKIIQHINWPKDFGQTKPKGSEQTQMIDTASIEYEGLSGKLHDSNSNLKRDSNSNSNARPAAVPGGSNKFDGKAKNPKAYAQAVRADEEQQARALKRKDEKPSGEVKSAIDVARVKLRAKGLNV